MPTFDFWRIKLRPGDRYRPANRLAIATLLASCVFVVAMVGIVAFAQFFLLLSVGMIEEPSSELIQLFEQNEIVFFVGLVAFSLFLLASHAGMFLSFCMWMSRTTRNILIISAKDARFLSLWGYQMAGTPLLNNFVAWFYFRDLGKHLILDSAEPDTRLRILGYFKTRCRILALSMLCLLTAIALFLWLMDRDPESLPSQLSILMGTVSFFLIVMAYCWNSMIFRVNDLTGEKHEEYLRTAASRCPECGEPYRETAIHCEVCGAEFSFSTEVDVYGI
ncbi:hypothetical protein Pla110_16820 [Polystyrenella longa]|uniref:Zinc-ribbon domain-containing protein n=1 Tax=Polystyrenella longa TaxID=2528007 RepID=A0A518CL58_9PLAN|nr:zinc ribbon domain-containing protein [Polystyrenella longa]QDU79960.1 hypothetical protein Pla110_16820 [Polystyrenella longa]